MTTDYLGPVGASLSRTGSRGTDSAPIPANVRMYDVAGASHVRDPDGTGCELPPGQLDWFPVMRAVLVALDLWVAQNRPPPPNSLISLKPRSPGEKALPTRAPASLPNAVLQMPQEDADGNFIGGVRLPDVEAPLGVHGALNSESCRDYLNRIRVATRRLIEQGFLLQEDGAIIIPAAAQSPAFE
jgi:Alpha/beta hydrolase domain